MAGSFLDSLTERYSTLTRSEKKLAGYIFANSTEVQYLSINSLAESSGVSEATITRFLFLQPKAAGQRDDGRASKNR